MRRELFGPEHADFRESVRAFLAREAVPHTTEWEEAGMVDRAFWRKAAAQGLVGFEAPAELGGADIDDFRFNAIVDEEVAYAGVAGDGFTMENDIIAPYLVEHATDAQRAAWLPGFTAGELVVAIAMTEPGAGSDLRGIESTIRRDGDTYVVNGSKTFVTSGIQADLVIVAGRTGDSDRLSLVMVEADREGFQRGRKLEKIGRRAQDTAELFFDDVRVPLGNLLGSEGRGLDLLKANLPRERLSMAVSAVAVGERAFAMTLEHCRDRRTFGKPLGSHQAVRFMLADMRIELDVARTYIDRCIAAQTVGELSAEEAAGAKAWATDLQFSLLDRCLQLHGGYGYMEEYPIARLWRDGRVQRIYGGANEIMRDIVGRGLGV
ncbi:MAG: acyl-CoA dehydrogenase family protein [Solirubrobacterales bacterium]